MAPSALLYGRGTAAAAMAASGSSFGATTACALSVDGRVAPASQLFAAHLPSEACRDSASSISASSSAGSLDSLAQPAPSLLPPIALGDSLDGAAAAEPPSLTAANPRFAYATLLTRDGYLPGVQALARSLRGVGSRHPLLVIYTADTLSSAAVAALEAEPGCEPLAVERYVPPGMHDFGAYKLQLYAECWTKLRLWELEQYERLVYLDADMLVLRNVDALFNLPPGFYAGPDCTAGRKSQAERDGCPLFFPHERRYFNAGFFVMAPSAAELARFGALLDAGEVPIGGYAEQDFLNAVYKDCWQQLPHTFNCQKGIKQHHPKLWKEHWHEVAILHYTDAKPWQRDHPEHKQHRELVELWWRVYDRASVAAGLAARPSLAMH
ncbi:hypothetical protein ABPG77_008445 [Micractinium sp. CCAP 211/92]